MIIDNFDLNLSAWLCHHLLRPSNTPSQYVSSDIVTTTQDHANKLSARPADLAPRERLGRVLRSQRSDDSSSLIHTQSTQTVTSLRMAFSLLIFCW